MDVAVSHLVDSNVFLRALLLSVERILASDRKDGRRNGDEMVLGPQCQGFLTHTWCNVSPLGEIDFDDDGIVSFRDEDGEVDDYKDDIRIESEWFPPFMNQPHRNINTNNPPVTNLVDRRGHFGWRFDPYASNNSHAHRSRIDCYRSTNTFTRLAQFLIINQTYLLKELLNEVDLRRINHENICCLNTAILISIFAHRRGDLAKLVAQLRAMDGNSKQSESSITTNGATSLLTRFRALLWFWSEYYTHRGRDRLSLEFSTHVRFREWKHVVDLLCSDGGKKGGTFGLVAGSVRLPKSPYRRAERV